MCSCRIENPFRHHKPCLKTFQPRLVFTFLSPSYFPQLSHRNHNNIHLSLGDESTRKVTTGAMSPSPTAFDPEASCSFEFPGPFSFSFGVDLARREGGGVRSNFPTPLPRVFPGWTPAGSGLARSARSGSYVHVHARTHAHTFNNKQNNDGNSPTSCTPHSLSRYNY